MKSWIYANAAGCFVVDESGKIIDSFQFTEDEAVSFLSDHPAASKKVEEAAKSLSKKHPQVSTVGFSDDDVPLAVLRAFSDKKFLKVFRSVAFKVTRHKVAKSVKRDALIVQAIDQIDELDTVSNMLVKRLREWYGLHNPEFSQAVEDHRRFVESILKEDREALLKKIDVDPKLSMGSVLPKDDVSAILALAKRIALLYELRDEQLDYVESVMDDVCPNVKALCGGSIGAKLLSIAGSLERLSLMPASTVQLLGAEKALFRHLRNKSCLPPKYGVIMNHPLVSKVRKDDKGKAARALADKISIAAKVDYFKGKPIASDLRKQLVAKFGDY
jgi:nucleolar protein 56